jgi:hypothetical protein
VRDHASRSVVETITSVDEGGLDVEGFVENE